MSAAQLRWLSQTCQSRQNNNHSHIRSHSFVFFSFLVLDNFEAPMSWFPAALTLLQWRKNSQNRISLLGDETTHFYSLSHFVGHLTKTLIIWQSDSQCSVRQAQISALQLISIGTNGQSKAQDYERLGRQTDSLDHWQSRYRASCNH